MKKKLIFILGILGLIISSQSCKKESSELIDSSYKIIENQNGVKMLEFKDDNAFNDAVSARENDEFLRILSDKYGFTSYYSRYLEFLDRVNDESLTDEAEYRKILADYADVLLFEGDMILPKLNHPHYLHLISPEGMVKVGNKIIVITETEEITSLDGNETLLRSAVQSNELIENIDRYSYVNTDNLKGGGIPIFCGSYQENRYTRIDGSRAVNIYCRVTRGSNYSPYNNMTTYWTNVSFVGLPFRKNMWNNWVGYKADNHMNFSYFTSTNNNIEYQLMNGSYSNSNKDRIQYDNVVASGQHYGHNQYLGNYEGRFNWLNIVYRSSGIPVIEEGVKVECGWY